MNFLDSEKSKAIRWFRKFAELLETGQADLVPSSLSREDYGNELRLSGTIVPSPKKVKPPTPTPTKIDTGPSMTQVFTKAKMTPSQAQQCYDLDKRLFICPKCKTFETKSETGLKKHYNRCKAGCD